MDYPVLAIHTLVSFALLGLIWLVQIVQYPGFAKVPTEGFVAYHHAHTRNIGFVVIPLMFTELVTAGLMVIETYVSSSRAWIMLSLTLVIWFSTFLLQVPCHRRLSHGKDSAVIRRLILTNWVRTLIWSLKSLLLFLWYF